LSIVI